MADCSGELGGIVGGEADAELGAVDADGLMGEPGGEAVAFAGDSGGVLMDVSMDESVRESVRKSVAPPEADGCPFDGCAKLQRRAKARMHWVMRNCLKSC